MSWRRVPPVYSPVTARALLHGGLAALGAGSGLDAVERTITATFDARDTLLTDSGTSALVLALRASAGPGATVAMPGYACIDIIAAAIGADVRVALYDVDPDTLAPDASSVRRVLTAGARALVVAPLYGYPADMPALAALAAQHGVPLVEDAAQAAGATLRGRRLGAFGDLTVLSFGRGKGTTGGSGGALLVRNDRFRAFADAWRREAPRGRRGVRALAGLGAQWLLARPALYALPSSLPVLRLGEMVYHEPAEPRPIAAAPAAALRDALDADAAEARVRAAHAVRLADAAAGGSTFRPIRALPGALPGYLRLALRDMTGRAQPAPALGVLRGYPVALDEHPATARVLHALTGSLAGTRALRDRLFTAPTHSRVSERDLERLARWLQQPAGAGA